MVWGLVVAALGFFAFITFKRAQNFARKAEAENPPVGEFVEVDGVSLHYIKQGTGPALILIHGAGGNLKDFTFNYVEQFSKEFTVIAFDRIGHGYSPVLKKSGATLAQQAALIYKAAQQLGVMEAYVFGFSYGGALALHMVTHYQSFVKGLVLASAVAMPWPGQVHPNYRIMSIPLLGPALMTFVTAYFSDAYFRRSYASVFHPHAAPKGFLDHVGVNMSVRVDSFVENSRQLNSLRPQIVEQARLYKNLTMPVEMIHGTADTSVPIHIHAEKFIKIVPHAHLVRVKGVSHGTHQMAIAQIEAAVYAVANANSERSPKEPLNNVQHGILQKCQPPPAL